MKHPNPFANRVQSTSRTRFVPQIRLTECSWAVVGWSRDQACCNPRRRGEGGLQCCVFCLRRKQKYHHGRDDDNHRHLRRQVAIGVIHALRVRPTRAMIIPFPGQFLSVRYYPRGGRGQGAGGGEFQHCCGIICRSHSVIYPHAVGYRSARLLIVVLSSHVRASQVLLITAGIQRSADDGVHNFGCPGAGPVLFGAGLASPTRGDGGMCPQRPCGGRRVSDAMRLWW